MKQLWKETIQTKLLQSEVKHTDPLIQFLAEQVLEVIESDAAKRKASYESPKEKRRKWSKRVSELEQQNNNNNHVQGK